MSFNGRLHVEIYLAVCIIYPKQPKLKLYFLLYFIATEKVFATTYI